MKRSCTALMMGAVLASVIGVSGVGGAHHQCLAVEINFQFCGEHPRLSKLPLRFHVNLASRPNNLTESEALAAVSGAIDAWNAAWPLPSGDPACPVLCLAGTTSKVGFFEDTQNTISWGPNFGSCGGNAHDGVAVACMLYEGSSGALRHRIAEVDIILNSNKAWYQPLLLDTGEPSQSDPLEVAAGEATMVWPELGENNQYDLIGKGKGKYDVQSAITHELGHAVGLEDIGDVDTPYPGPLSDSAKYQQTMYRWYYRGTTYKRSLAEGDIAGVARVAAATAIDGG